MDDVTPFLPADTVAYLRIADSERRFPFRPVSPGLFLIGQGRSCDLRLGNDNVPTIHSVLQVDREHAVLNRISDYPELLVNGTPVESAMLEHGDLVEIADIRLIFLKCEPAELADRHTAVERGLKLSPEDLLDRIQTELDLIDHQTDSAVRLQELLKAAHQATESQLQARTLRFADYLAEQAASRLQNAPFDEKVFAALKQQETRLSEVCSVLEQVVQQQMTIAAALQGIAERLNDQRSGDSGLRASA